ncbi:hypothetical protein DM819_15145 [Pseudomonas hunanensis]|uniref:Uncharacterized protein n=1 Tax=Pseudomonas hunanensis TaxID=1247546 RepID=A0ABD6MZX6_9PSED|nr:hypothetical protein [Pseudomonas hunanensis]NWL47150.1 hypothetical protein [Pseudomonas hunanensis]
MNLYLYGKKQFLGDLIEGRKGIRLSDIVHYSVMDNELMRDNELEKNFTLDKDKVSIEINGYRLSPLSMPAHPSVLIRPDRCFCVCFSTKKNDADLFARFDADVCIEIDRDRLLEVLRHAVSTFVGMEVVHGPVTYYPDVMADPIPDLQSSLFYKRALYSIESEYRVALTIPRGKNRFRSPDGFEMNIFSDDPGDLHHLFINGNTPDINKYYISGVFFV